MICGIIIFVFCIISLLFRYFLFASYLFISVIKDCWSQKTKSIDYSKVYDLLLVLFIHRLARYPYEINRRRWTLEGFSFLYRLLNENVFR